MTANSGTNTDSSHHVDDADGVKVSRKNNSALAMRMPRNPPKTAPSARSVPDKPVA